MKAHAIRCPRLLRKPIFSLCLYSLHILTIALSLFAERVFLLLLYITRLSSSPYATLPDLNIFHQVAVSSLATYGILISSFVIFDRSNMTVDVKITVLETSLKKDLADEYAVPNLEPCPVLKAGQVFYATNTCPKGMCDAAWRTINQYVFALACGVREFYGGGWMKEPGKVITCCNDGLRPVYFKLEATDEQAGPFLGRD